MSFSRHSATCRLSVRFEMTMERVKRKARISFELALWSIKCAMSVFTVFMSYFRGRGMMPVVTRTWPMGQSMVLQADIVMNDRNKMASTRSQARSTARMY